jgi:hypothetical protein
MIDWIGYGWMAGSMSGADMYSADLTMEVPRGDVVAAAAVTGFSLGVWEEVPGSAAAYVRQFGLFEEGLQAVRSLDPDPNNNVVPITDCYWIRFRLTVFQGNAFGQGLVFHHAPPPPPPPHSHAAIPKASKPAWKTRDYHVTIGGRKVGSHRIMSLARGSLLTSDEVLAGAASEVARHFGVKPREVVTRPGRATAVPRGRGTSPRYF